MDESLENEELFTLAKRAKDKSKKAKPEVDVPIDDFKFLFLDLLKIQRNPYPTFQAHNLRAILEFTYEVFHRDWQLSFVRQRNCRA